MEFDDDTNNNTTSTSNTGVDVVVDEGEEEADLVQIRLSNLSSETEKLLTAIIDEEQQKLHPRGTGEDDAEQPRPPPSITLQTTRGDGAGPQRRSSSTLSFRRSLLSQTTADQIMEGLFEEVNTNHNSHRSDPNTSSTVASVPSMEVSSLASSATNTDPLPYQPRTSMDSIMIDEDCYNIINTTEDENDDDRIDPSVFGGGGGTQHSPSRKSLVLSRRTLDLFDRAFEENDDDMVVPMSSISMDLDKVSKVTSSSFKQESDAHHQLHMAAIEEEMEALTVDQQQKIIFDVHGFPIQTSINTHNATATPQAGSAAELQYFQLCLECLDEELLDHNLTQLLGSRAQPGLPSRGTTYTTAAEAALRSAEAQNAEYVTTIKLLILQFWIEGFTTQNAGRDIVKNRIVEEDTDRPFTTLAGPLTEAAVTAAALATRQDDDDNDATEPDPTMSSAAIAVATVIAKKAAVHLVHHFDVKHELFPPDKGYAADLLGRDVRLSDMSSDDMEAMNSGFEQILPHRDSAGRIVILYAPSQRQYKDDANWMRVMFYMGTQLMITASATNTHKIGNVFLHHGRGSLLPHQRGSFATVKKFEHVRDAFCLVMKACHFCYSGTDTETMKVLFAAQMVHFLPKSRRIRSRTHIKTNHDELCFELDTYGIPIDKSIFLPNGHLGLDWHKEWLSIRYAIESSQRKQEHHQQQQQHTSPPSPVLKNTRTDGGGTIEISGKGTSNPAVAAAAAAEGGKTTSILAIRKSDVLFGRGKHSREHPGTMRCAILVENHLHEYNTASKVEKTFLSIKLVGMVHNSGGRFLKKDKQIGWQEVDDEAAREKVSHFFRHLRGKKKTAIAGESLSSSEKRAAPAVLQQQQKQLDVDRGHENKSLKM